MAKRAKLKQKKTTPKKTQNKGTRILGQVRVDYTQVHIPDHLIEASCEALAKALTSEYYQQFCVTTTEEF